MERVVKRYFLHNQGDLDDPKQNEFDDIKSELQTMRYEMISDMKKSKEDSARNMYIVNGSIQFIAEEIMINYKNDYDDHQSLMRYKELINAHQYLLASFNSFSAACCPLDYTFTNSNSNTSVTSISGYSQNETQNENSNSLKEYSANNNNSNSSNNNTNTTIVNSNRKRSACPIPSIDPLNIENSNYINNNFSKTSAPSKVTFDLFENKILQTISEESNSQFNSSSK